jgi:nucleoside-diphosphate-sugar epimerase
MKVFVAGASGAIGTRLVPQLIDRGHDVLGTATSPERTKRVSALGAEAVVLDLLDPRAVREAVLAAKPEAIVHQATALANLSDFKHFDRSFAQTNRLRTEGTDALLAAAREAGVRRLVAQTTRPPRPCTHSTVTVRRSSTSSTTSPPPRGSGSPRSRRSSEPSRPAASRPGSPGYSRGRPWS